MSLPEPAVLRRTPRRALRYAAALAAALIAVSLITVWPSRAAVPSLDQIRVGLFLNVPGKYTTTVPQVTLTSPEGLSIGVRMPEGTAEWFRTGAAESARFMLDNYRVKWLETADFNTALTLNKRIAALKGSGTIISLPKGGKTVYQVTEGSYATAAEAKSALDRIGKDATVAGIAGKGAGSVAGPLHLETGAYETLGEAEQAAQTYGAAGLDTFVAVKGPGVYTVAIGAASDNAGISILKAAVVKAGLTDSLVTMNASAPYLLLRNDHTATASALSSTPLYSLPATDAKIWLAPLGDGGIKVAERYARSYRGGFELSGLNGKLAVVNELPFEQYLYSVVGGEMPSSWPAEALKAQAVAARSYALNRGFGFQIAHVVDGTLSQAYNGIGTEKPSTIAAVEATKGEVALYQGKVIDAVFSSSAGGATAEGSEIWGNATDYLQSIASPDGKSEEGLYTWYRVALADGRTGYIRADIVDVTNEKTAAGSSIVLTNAAGSTIRPIPLIQSDVDPVAKVDKGTRLVVLEKTIQSNEMNWVRGPFTPDSLAATLKKSAGFSGSLQTLEIGEKGESGRALSVLANGAKVKLSYPDQLRSALGGLPSTRFAIDETGRYTVLGGGGQTRSKPGDGGAVYAAGAGGGAKQLKSGGLYVLNGAGDLRAATLTPGFRFVGTGNGHGAGLSQWGARGLADQGYDYQKILKYYYKNVTIAAE